MGWIDAFDRTSNMSILHPLLCLGLWVFKSKNGVNNIMKRNLSKNLSMTFQILHQAKFIVIDNCTITAFEISFLKWFFTGLKLWVATEVRVCFWQPQFYFTFHFLLFTHHRLRADCELTPLSQSNLFTFSLFATSCQPDQSGCRHWIFWGWPHPYRDRLLLWGDGSTSRGWGDWTRRDTCTGKKKKKKDTLISDTLQVKKYQMDG